MKKYENRGNSPAGVRSLPGGALALVLFAFFQGCQPASPARSRPAPFVDPASPEDLARRREQYRKNRPAAPAEYRVFPVPPKDNSFGEFADDRFRGLDSQPELPALPVDFPPPSREMPPPSGVSAMARPAPAAIVSSRAAEARPHPLPARMPARTASAAPAGITADGHFYPVEQLVYGGDYPDIDRPELYRFMPKDVITITIRDHPELSGQVEIQPDGTVGIPNAPDLVRVRGLTVDEAAEAVRRVVSAYVKGECRVRIQANRARGGYYFVFGDVLQPGRFPMGLEPIRLSDAILAANWEANPARLDMDGDELGPSFPAASPRGRYAAPRTADLAKVVVITPHRSQPIRTVHDARSALLGMTADDPAIRPGQLIVVPSLDSARNENLGRIGVPTVNAAPATPRNLERESGFSRADAPARLPDAAPPPPRRWSGGAAPVSSGFDVEANMISAFDVSFNTAVDSAEAPSDTASPTASTLADPPARAGGGWRKGF